MAGKKGASGAKPKFEDEELKGRFLSAIRMGLSNEKACDYSGITEPTLYLYLKKGAEDIEAGTDSIYSNFSKEYKKAKADFVMKHAERITQAADDGSWQASAWLLERRVPNDFGAKQQIDLGDSRITVVSDVPADED